MPPTPRRPKPKLGKDGQYHAWITIDDPNHESGRIHIKRTTYEDCEAKVDEIWDNLQAGIRPEPSSKMPLPDWVDEYLDTVLPMRTRNPVSPDTIRKYSGWVANWIRPNCTVPIGRLTGTNLLRLYKAMRAAGLSGSSQNSLHYLIQGALEAALLEGFVTRNVAKLVEAPEEDPPPIQVFTIDEARRILHQVKGHPMEARFAIGMCLAVRQGEVLGLRWSHVHMGKGEQQRIHVEWQLGRRIYVHGCGSKHCGRKRAVDCPKRALPLKKGEIQLRKGLILKPPKGGHTRAVPLPTEVVDLLKAHRKEWLRRKLVSPAWASHDLVFCTDAGQPIDPKVDQEVWRSTLVAAGVEHRKGHTMRHTAATSIFGVSSIEVAQEVLGHTSEAMTRQYLHLAEEKLASAKAAEATQSNARELFG